VSVGSEVAGYWGAGALRTLNAVRTGFGAPENDPPVGEEVVNLRNITAPLLNMVADFDDVVHPNASKPLARIGSVPKTTATCISRPARSARR
jgi:hypothetical protein